MDAKVHVKNEYTVLAPNGVAISDHHGFDYTTHLHGAASLKCAEANEALNKIGVLSYRYTVAKRTITTVTSPWESTDPNSEQ
jgi:hypothetical protein